ncbi:M56 family metallopeptidase [Roseateles sp.]|uniref:M56 family metallopeptidase n=1 Tax=Roseateles sp. TaxID=1971397 RepID=UPI003BAD3066
MNPILSTLMSQTLAVTAAVLLVALLRRPLARAFDARAAYLLWLCVPVALVVAPMPSPLQLGVTPLTVLQDWAAPANAAAAGTARQPGAAQPLPWTQIVIATWAAGALLLALALFVQQRRFGRLLRPAPGWTHWQLPAGASACVVGIWPPRLALPADFSARFNAEERQLIVAHEGVHLRRRDNLWNLLAGLCCCLQWFNPLCWWAWRRMRADQELACDAAVLIERHPGADLACYAQALVRSHDQANRALLPTLASPRRSRSGLVERVAQLQAHATRRGKPRRDRTIIAMLVLATAGMVSATAAVQPGAKPSPDDFSEADALPADVGDVEALTMLNWRLQSREGDAAPQNHTGKLLLRPGRSPGGMQSRYVEKSPDGPLWCFETVGTRFEDGSWRFSGRLMDGQCKVFLADPQNFPADGMPHTFNARLPDGKPLSVDISGRRFALPATMAWVDVNLDHNLNIKTAPVLWLMGPLGERMRMQARPPTGEPGEPLAMELIMTDEGGGRARVKSRLLLGEPERLLAEPQVVTRWNEPATIRWQDPASGQRVEVTFTPHRNAAKP